VERKLEPKSLLAYGDYLATYNGNGTLTLEDTQTISCTFEAGQLRNGEIRLLCSSSDFFALSTPIKKFNGTTIEGYQVSSARELLCIDYQVSSRIGTWVAYRLHEMMVQMSEHVRAQNLRFGLTNFLFRSPLPLRLEHENDVAMLSIQPPKEHSDIQWNLTKLRGIDVTCEVVGNIPPHRDKKWLEHVVDALCYLLSVARGTKVEWIYCDQYDGNGTCLSRTHASRVTKNYCPLSVLKDDPETKVFVEKIYGTYRANREDYRLDLGTIDAYLDAKAENDYLQLRGIKLAVAMEALKAVLLKLPQINAKEYILGDNDFKSIRRKIEKFVRDELKVERVGSIQRSEICRKLSELNRRPFKDILIDLFDYIDLRVEEQDLALFVKCRDSLVHQGRFYYETATLGDRKQVEPLHSEIEEYCFLVNFLDKVLLKLLGYSGPYIDRRIPTQPIHREQV
jgi:hypothetical protein